jgi:hypothetical protein
MITACCKAKALLVGADAQNGLVAIYHISASMAVRGSELSLSDLLI